MHWPWAVLFKHGQRRSRELKALPQVVPTQIPFLGFWKRLGFTQGRLCLVRLCAVSEARGIIGQGRAVAAFDCSSARLSAASATVFNGSTLWSV